MRHGPRTASPRGPADQARSRPNFLKLCSESSGQNFCGKSWMSTRTFGSAVFVLVSGLLLFAGWFFTEPDCPRAARIYDQEKIIELTKAKAVEDDDFWRRGGGFPTSTDFTAFLATHKIRYDAIFFPKVWFVSGPYWRAGLDFDRNQKHLGSTAHLTVCGEFFETTW